MDVGQWLRDLGLGQYVAAFHEQEIDAEILPNLTAEDLKDLGVATIGHRRKLLTALAALKGSGSASWRARTTKEPTADGFALPGSLGERRHLTVMFCDLVGSTALAAQLDPEDMREILRAYQACCAKVVGRYEGFVAQYLGDGIVVYFGYPGAHEDDPDRAVRAGLDLIAAVASLQTRAPIEVRVGIATGLVVVGDIVGDEGAEMRAVTGDTPNLAARLQSLASPRTVMISEATRRLLGSRFELDDLGLRAIKGLAEPVPTWNVLRPIAEENRFETLRSGSPICVGRDEELSILDRRWRTAQAGEGRVVLLAAEPGVGKSRLVAALIDKLDGHFHTLLQFFCSQHHQHSALSCVIARLEHAARFEPSDSPATKFGKLATMVMECSTAPEDVVLLADLLSLPLCGEYAPLNASPQRKKEKTLEALLRHVMGLAKHRPLLLILEDMHWIDHSSREFLDILLRHIGRQPVLVIATFRPEFRPPWSSHALVTTLTLTRLGPKDAAALARQIARAGPPLPDDLIEQIVARADGVPLFLEELTKAVLETAGADARRSLATDTTPDLAVPATLQASLIARLDRIGASAKEIAQVGAAIGREFSYEFLAAATRHAAADLQDALGRLVAAELVFQRGSIPEATFSFKHALVQDAAYSTLVRGARRALHGQIADALLAVSESERVAPEVIALHMQSAERPGEAMTYWQRAGERAARQANHRDAVVHFRRALSLLEAQPPADVRWRAELVILSQLGAALMSLHGWAAAEVGAVVDQASAVGGKLASSAELAPSIANLWMFHYANGRLDAAEGVSDDLIRIGNELNSDEMLLQAHHTAWPVRWARGALSGAIAHIDAGLALYDEERHAHHRFHYLGHDPAVCGLAIAAQLHVTLGEPERAKDAGDRALALARKLAHEPSLAHALWFVVEAQMTSHDTVGVIANTGELLTIAESYGLPQPRAVGLVYRGWALASAGQAADGLALAREGIGLLDRSGARIFLSRTHCALAEIHAIRGCPADGLTEIEKALRIASDIGESFYLPRIFQVRARLMLACGRPETAAEESLQQSLALARRQGAKLLELRAAIDLAALWRSPGRCEKGRELLQSICARFRCGGDVQEIREAQALLKVIG